MSYYQNQELKLKQQQCMNIIKIARPKENLKRSKRFDVKLHFIKKHMEQTDLDVTRILTERHQWTSLGKRYYFNLLSAYAMD